MVNKQNKIPIFLSSDNNYAPMVATTILSILSHSSLPVDFYVLDSGISKKNKTKIIKSIKSEIDYSLNFINIDMNLISNLTTPEHYLSYASYNRLLIPEINKNLKKVIYSDVDIICQDDIAELYRLDLGHYAIGAIPDVYYKYNDTDVRQRLDLNENHHYFYSGLLLVDCEKWREENITSKLFQISDRYKEKIHQGDQDVLNIYFNSNYKEINPRFEVTNLMIKYSDFLNEEEKQAVKKPAIRHYESEEKPWNKKSFLNEPMRDFDLFWQYAKLTIFYSELKFNFIIMDKLKNRCKKLFSHLMYLLGHLKGFFSETISVIFYLFNLFFGIIVLIAKILTLKIYSPTKEKDIFKNIINNKGRVAK